MKWSGKDRQFNRLLGACHELSHAVACIHLRSPFSGVRLGRIRHKRLNGVTAEGCLLRPKYARVRNEQAFWKNEIIICFAGDAGTKALYLHSTGGAGQDEQDARDYATHKLGISAERVESFLEPLRKRAEELFRKPHIESTILQLAPILAKTGCLSASEIRASYNRCKRFELLLEGKKRI